MQSAAGRKPWWRKAGTAAAVAAAAMACLAALAAWPRGGNTLVVALRGAAPAPPRVAADGDVGAEAGARLLASWQCGSCHRIEGIPGAQGTTAPALSDLARRSYIAGRLPLTPEVLVQWIVDPPALLPGTAMPALGVPPADARAMAAWLLADAR